MEETPQQTEERQRRFMRRLAASFWSADSYGLVLLLILLSYALSVSLYNSSWGASVVLAIQIATVWFVLRTSHARRGVRIFASVLLGLSAAVALLNLFAPHATHDNGIVPLTAGLLYFIASVSIIKHLGTRSRIDLETFLGSISAYLSLGLCFAWIYFSLGAIQGGDFFGSQGDGTFPQVLFFSFTTLTTTGYGNLVPAGNPGQSFAVLEMLLGQFFLLTAVAKVVAGWTPQRRSTTASD
jgi:Ion channel